MLNMVKSEVKLVAHTVHTPSLNQEKTCLTKICWQDGLGFVLLVKLVRMGYKTVLSGSLAVQTD